MEKVTIERKSMVTGEINSMSIAVNVDDITSWRNGMLIQDAMPYLNAWEREFLISGMSIEEQKVFFDQEANDEPTD
jgi:hypothetical protein